MLFPNSEGRTSPLLVTVVAFFSKTFLKRKRNCPFLLSSSILFPFASNDPEQYIADSSNRTYISFKSGAIARAISLNEQITSTNILKLLRLHLNWAELQASTTNLVHLTLLQIVLKPVRPTCSAPRPYTYKPNLLSSEMVNPSARKNPFNT